jgi:hypothetical protein
LVSEFSNFKKYPQNLGNISGNIHILCSLSENIRDIPTNFIKLKHTNGKHVWKKEDPSSKKG